MKRIIGILVVAIVATVGGVNSEARADHHSHHHRSHHHSYSPSRLSISVGGFNYSSGYGYGSYNNCQPRTPVWHDTSHYDYHPTEVIRHRGHYDVLPGHYDYHRSGHWDY